ncbi:hypothetical protein CHS0354_016850 [Potamilus streckersoni]|uniref:Cation efflux protein cytoplasmic domain-containing protein n=1 Tax=Potamilus streckersoni TaxID=2493646 RepID=A0AAE0W2J9_9BIVA|nr:hypothetical protein CHS0354_016850 [Potamilus streckersoni]
MAGKALLEDNAKNGHMVLKPRSSQDLSYVPDDDVAKLTVRKSRSLGNLRNKNREMSPEEEGFLIGRSGKSNVSLDSDSVKRSSHSHIRMTQVAPSHSTIVTSPKDDKDWKVSIAGFTSKKHGKSEEYRKMPRRLKSYYKAQDELIQAYEAIQMEETDVMEEQNDEEGDRKVEILAKITFGINFSLLVAKAVAVALSSSISIISSLVDSAVDLISGIVIWYTSSAMKKRNLYLYPVGRSRLEPTAIVILSVIMSIASFQLVVESIQKIAAFASNATNEESFPIVELPTILISVFTIVTKFILVIVCKCFGRGSPSINALAQDHRNDVLSNIVAIVCGYLGSKQFVETTKERGVTFIDPIGAILISLYILFNWWRTGYEQIKLLTGYTAKPEFLSKITWICLNHHPQIIEIDTVRAFHFGNNFLVEVDIVLPKDMSLKESHDIGESLQQKIEKFPTVERAFVHLDYETTHHPNEEHKRV